MHGNNRNFCSALLTLDDEAIEQVGEGQRPRRQAYAELAKRPEGARADQALIDQLNQGLANYESVKKFAVLPADLTLEAGELTPSLKVKRKVVEKKYKELLDGFYAGALEPEPPPRHRLLRAETSARRRRRSSPTRAPPPAAAPSSSRLRASQAPPKPPAAAPSTITAGGGEGTILPATTKATTATPLMTTPERRLERVHRVQLGHAPEGEGGEHHQPHAAAEVAAVDAR